MAELSTMARPYAKAVFELAFEAQALPQWSRTLSALALTVADPASAALLSDPRRSRSEVAGALISALGEGLGVQAGNLVRLLAENNRLVLLPAIAENFEALRAEAERRVEVEITTAAAVDPAQQEALLAAVRKRLAREVQVTWSSDPALVAGAVIRAGDLVIDGSIANELAQLRQSLMTI